MENRIVTAINGVSSVHISHDCVSRFLRAGVLVIVDLTEIRLLVCAGVRPQHGFIVDVVGICATAAGVIRRETEDIEIQGCRYDGVFLDVISIHWVRELAFDQPSCNGKRVVFVEV